MNIMIASLSLLYGKKDEIEYRSDNNDVFKGIQTNEAATKYFIKYLAEEKEKGESLDSIFYLVTKEVIDTEKNLHEYKGEKLSTENFYKIRIEEFYKEFYKNDNYKMPEGFFKPFDIDESNRIPDGLLTEINNIIKNGDDITVYIDTTGGLRTISLILQLLIKFLTYKNIKVGMVLYSQKPGKEGAIGTIQKVDTYDVLKVLDGVNQFITTGQCSILMEAFEGENTPEIKDLLSTMESFTNEILLCQTNKLDNILNKMKNQLIVVENHKYEKNTLILFSQFIPIIREKFFGSSDREGTDYISITKWCIDNGLIQQALTIYTEKIPVFIFDKIIEYDISNVADNKMNGTKEATALYSEILKTDKLKTESDSILDYIKEQWENCRSSKNEAKKAITDFFKINNTHIKRLRELVYDYFEKGSENNIDIAGLLKYCKEKDSKKGKALEALITSSNLCDISNADKKASVSSKKFLNSILNNKSCMKILLDLHGDKGRKDIIRDKLYAINTIEGSVTSGEVKLKDKAKISIESLQNILYDYVYIKTVRNMINHANQNETLLGDNGRFYADRKYGEILANGQLEISIDNIKNNIITGLDRLENICTAN